MPSTLVPVNAMMRTARRYGLAPHWFDEIGHNLMLEPRTDRVVDELV